MAFAILHEREIPGKTLGIDLRVNCIEVIEVMNINSLEFRFWNLFCSVQTWTVFYRK